MDYFDKKKKQKLYQQWVDKSGLPPESVPSDLEQKDDFNEPENDNSEKRRLGIQSGTFYLTMRHLLYLVLVIVVLLITTASLATILIMRSC